MPEFPFRRNAPADASRESPGPETLTVPRGKARITIRLDVDVLAWFRRRADETDANYQSLINAALRRQMMETEQPLEKVLRRVVREELARSRSSFRR